jgi:hypothetical protein
VVENTLTVRSPYAGARAVPTCKAVKCQVRSAFVFTMEVRSVKLNYAVYMHNHSSAALGGHAEIEEHPFSGTQTNVIFQCRTLRSQTCYRILHGKASIICKLVLWWVGTRSCWLPETQATGINYISSNFTNPCRAKVTNVFSLLT